MTNWYVVTGAPCSGKTTLLDSLKERGYNVIPEVARTYIDTKLAGGISVEELRSDELKFQEDILKQKYKLEEALSKDITTFFDRGIPDSYAYFKLLDVEDISLLEKSLLGNYKKVFILDPCPFEGDYARTENPKDQLKLHYLIVDAYEKTGAMIVRVPIFATKKERVDFILDNL